MGKAHPSGSRERAVGSTRVLGFVDVNMLTRRHFINYAALSTHALTHKHARTHTLMRNEPGPASRLRELSGRGRRKSSAAFGKSNAGFRGWTQGGTGRRRGWCMIAVTHTRTERPCSMCRRKRRRTPSVSRSPMRCWPGPRANACAHVGSHKNKNRQRHRDATTDAHAYPLTCTHARTQVLHYRPEPDDQSHGGGSDEVREDIQNQNT